MPPPPRFHDTVPRAESDEEEQAPAPKPAANKRRGLMPPPAAKVCTTVHPHGYVVNPPVPLVAEATVHYACKQHLGLEQLAFMENFLLGAIGTRATRLVFIYLLFPTPTASAQNLTSAMLTPCSPCALPPTPSQLPPPSPHPRPPPAPTPTSETVTWRARATGGACSRAVHRSSTAHRQRLRQSARRCAIVRLA